MSEQRAEAEVPDFWRRNEEPRTFRGYRRKDGRAGVRNYIGVLTSVNCSATVARHIAEAAEKTGLLDGFDNVDGIVPITHASGCGMAGAGEGFDLLRRTLWGTAANPNFGAIMLVGLGCEVLQIQRLKADYGIGANAEFESFTIQDVGGTRRAIAEGLDRLRALLPQVNAVRRTEMPASELVLGLQCGGSDAWSGVTSNPALGNASDRLVNLGGTAILSETPEIYGAEHLLYARARVAGGLGEAAGAARLVGALHASINGAEMNNNPSPGNKAGGLSTILEKSLGAVAKAGTSPLNDVIEYAQAVHRTRPRVHGQPRLRSLQRDRPGGFGRHDDRIHDRARFGLWLQALAIDKTLLEFRNLRAHARRHRYRLRNDRRRAKPPSNRRARKFSTYLLEVASGRKSKSEELGYGGAEFVPWQVGAVM